MKCFNCKKEVKDYAENNEDEDGNKYCMDCVAKIDLIVNGG